MSPALRFPALALGALLAGCAPQAPDPYATAAEQQAALQAGDSSSRALVRAVLARIEALGPLPTTAGSWALAANVTNRDAPLVARLRAAGAVIIGKANLSEWANFRSTQSISGWSGIGGLTRNPHVLDRSACGSSTGSAVAVASGIVPVSIGTETDGSIICPAAATGIVGFKPTLGLVSRTRIVPLSPEQDTAGPFARTVADAAAVLTVIAGSDPEDAATAEADAHRTDYAAALDVNSLSGTRIGVLRGVVAMSPDLQAVFERALDALRAAGATLVDVQLPEQVQRDALSNAEYEALLAEFRDAIDRYLATTPAAVQARSLEALIAFNKADAREMPLFAQEIFEQAAKMPALNDPQYLEQRATARRLAGPEGIDRMLADASVEALVSPSLRPAPVIDQVNGERFGGSPTDFPAVAGYPHLTVPMGAVSGLPVGLSFIGPRWSDARVLSLGHAFEQRVQYHPRPGFFPSLLQLPETAHALQRQ